MIWIARLLALITLVGFPIAWIAPLAYAGINLPLFGTSEITILDGVVKLIESDLVLACIVVVFAILIPYTKTVFLIFIQYNQAKNPKRIIETLSSIGKWSMADVFLISLYIVIVKGVGIGKVEIAWGMYLFTLMVIFSMISTHITKNVLSFDS